jgi:hypothetical protein
MDVPAVVVDHREKKGRRMNEVVFLVMATARHHLPVFCLCLSFKDGAVGRKAVAGDGGQPDS